VYLKSVHLARICKPEETTHIPIVQGTTLFIVLLALLSITRKLGKILLALRAIEKLDDPLLCSPR
jgi:hypothetical protein